ncbi:4627_t:CDS:2, partial [Cetraspora pellucida]
MDESDIQDIELEALITYDSAEDFSDIDEFNDNEEETLELFVGERTDTTTREVIKCVYLCHHAGKPSEKMQPNETSCQVGCPWRVNI